jgi:hypothetical protein
MLHTFSGCIVRHDVLQEHGGARLVFEPLAQVLQLRANEDIELSRVHAHCPAALDDVVHGTIELDAEDPTFHLRWRRKCLTSRAMCCSVLLARKLPRCQHITFFSKKLCSARFRW